MIYHDFVIHSTPLSLIHSFYSTPSHSRSPISLTLKSLHLFHFLSFLLLFYILSFLLPYFLFYSFFEFTLNLNSRDLNMFRYPERIKKKTREKRKEKKTLFRIMVVSFVSSRYAFVLFDCFSVRLFTRLRLIAK